MLIFTQENDEWVRHDSDETHALGEAIFNAITVRSNDVEPVRSLFDNATGEERGNLVKALNSLWFQHCGLPYADEGGDKFSPLHVACMSLFPQLAVAFLLSKGANVQAKSPLRGSTPLHIVVNTTWRLRDGIRLDIIKMLLESLEPQDRIALMNQQDIFKNAVFHIASPYFDDKIFAYFMSQPGINLSLQNGNGFTPMHFA